MSRLKTALETLGASALIAERAGAFERAAALAETEELLRGMAETLCFYGDPRTWGAKRSDMGLYTVAQRDKGALARTFFRSVGECAPEPGETPSEEEA